MKSFLLCALGVLCASSLMAADKLKSKSTYAESYGTTKNAVTVDPAKDLPRYPAIEPKDAIATWQVKKGFHLELAAHEPQVRSPIAISYDERGRMFACEMIDYSEMRDVTPHLGRVSMLEDKDGDGHFETSTVFADDLAWPTGLICANGGVFVIATPDLWFFKDTNGDGKADVREKVFTGFGTGLAKLNVQGLANSPQWGQDNRIHILAGGGNRGVMTCLKRPDLKGIELGGKDFWFDPRTFDFGLEGGGAQYGQSFDNYGRKFGCSNSDHLQYWVYDDRYAGRNPYFQMPSARQSIAVDGGAAEVFRLSPDEPWRIIRTRWRIAGVVKGAVEGGGRVSGYFTGATGTTIYRGDAYGADFVNNSFSGDAGGQLVHRKIIRPTADGISLEGERPADERGFEFAASKDTWVRVVNFANAPDGCLNILDMYREVIEHPWSIPDEIKKHIDLNNGNDRGRVYRIVPDGWQRAKSKERRGDIADSSTEELVKLLSHPNGWHRDTAQRLLYERNDKAAIPLLEKVLSGDNALAKLHALGALEGFGAMTEPSLTAALVDADPHVREAAIRTTERWIANGGKPTERTMATLTALNRDPSPRVRYQLILSAGAFPETLSPDRMIASTLLSQVPGQAASGDRPPAIARALVGGAAGAPQSLVWKTLENATTMCPTGFTGLFEQLAPLAQVSMSAGSKEELSSRLDILASRVPAALPALASSILTGVKRSGSTLEAVDSKGHFKELFARASASALDTKAPESARLEAIELLGLTSSKEATAALQQCLAQGQPDAVQFAAMKQLAQSSSVATTKTLLSGWSSYGPKTKAAAMDVMFSREDRAIALLESDAIKPADLTASQVQSLVHHKSAKVADVAKKVLASVIPPSREEVVAKFKPALTTKGDAVRGQNVFISRCMACHRAGTMGLQVGPDLVTVKTKGRDGILTAILEPHKEVAAQYIAYIVNTKDGQTLTGVVAEDNATSLTLKMMAGVSQTIQRSNIKGTLSSGQSLMPEGLEQGMTVQEMADLLTFIEELK